MLGRHPPPKHSSPSSSALSVDPDAAFCASLYSMGKGGVRTIDLGPEVGGSRKEVLVKLLEVLETEIGRMMLNDWYHARKVREAAGGSGRERG
jgi:hypothetical protein